ncbi:diacylglycerol kinase family protein [Kocuria sp. CPCC 205263]|uniref:diacylglycerol kinase family protein n=1 Tax=Kocuria sp. CPCC 205263 TaxID=3073555 RepID=UPI0034D43A72
MVVNPTKFHRTGELSRFRTEVDAALADLGWSSPLWLFTTASTGGTDQARETAAAGVDLVLVAGGDGTIRAVAQELAGSAVPLGLLPAGTGNLLARNLGVPLGDVAAAVRVACRGVDRRLDVGRLELDRTGQGTDWEAFPFLIMAGAGFDAAMMTGAGEQLKQRLGAAAYIVAGMRALRRPMTRSTIWHDGQEVSSPASHGVVVGNCGTLTMDLSLMPDADPGDGLLDGVALLPHSRWDWIRLAWAVATSNHRPHPLMPRFRGHTLEFHSQSPQPVQVDGDVVGEGHRIRLHIQQEGLLVRCPTATKAQSRLDLAA